MVSVPLYHCYIIFLVFFFFYYVLFHISMCAPLSGAIWFCPLWSFNFYILLQLHLLLIGYYLDYGFPHLVSVNDLKFYYHDELFSAACFGFTLILLLHFLSLKNLILYCSPSMTQLQRKYCCQWYWKHPWWHVQKKKSCPACVLCSCLNCGRRRGC